MPRSYSTSARNSRSLPSTARRDALSDRLQSAIASKGRSNSTLGDLAGRFSPTKNGAASSTVADRTRGRQMASQAKALPGKSRLEKLGSRSKSNVQGSKASRSVRGDSGRSAAKARTQRQVRRQYTQATSKDEALKTRLSSASRAASVASDVAIRTALDANPITRAYGGRNLGDGDYGDGYRDGYDDGYYDGANDYGGWCNWYWNSCFPYWCNWWYGGGCGFYGWGWGWGFSFGYCYNPCYSWPCYYPSYPYSYGWPTYAYCAPDVIYNYYGAEQPIVEEVPVASSPGLAVSNLDFSQRAASEYMGLGDRAFVEGRYGDAVHYYAKAIQFAPTDGVLYLVLSDALFATGDYHSASFAIKKALELTPELANITLDKRSFYGQPADFDEQLALLQAFVADHPIDHDARLVLAANYLFSLQPEQCLATVDAEPGTGLKNSTAGRLLLAASAGLMTTH